MPDWFTYDWRFDGEPARFTVDQAFLGGAPFAHMPVLFRVSCACKEGKSSIRRLEAMRISAIESKCLKAISPFYAGSIETNTRKVLYLYANSIAQLEPLEKIVMPVRGLFCEVAARTENDWRTYFDLLYPDAAKFQTEENRKYIELMRKGGDGIQPARRVRLHMFFKTEPLMHLFAEKARQVGFAVGTPEYAPEHAQAYGVVVLRVSSLEKREIDDVTTQVIRLAEEFEGTLLHWDCPLVPKVNPLK